MFKLLVLAALMAVAAAKPGLVNTYAAGYAAPFAYSGYVAPTVVKTAAVAPVAYSAGYTTGYTAPVAYSAYNAYTAPYVKTAYTAPVAYNGHLAYSAPLVYGAHYLA